MFNINLHKNGPHKIKFTNDERIILFALEEYIDNYTFHLENDIIDTAYPDYIFLNAGQKELPEDFFHTEHRVINSKPNMPNGYNWLSNAGETSLFTIVNIKDGDIEASVVIIIDRDLFNRLVNKRLRLDFLILKQNEITGVEFEFIEANVGEAILENV